MADNSAQDSAEQKRDALLRLIADAKAQANKLEEQGQKIVEYARLTGDVADPVYELVEHIPPNGLTPSEWDQQLSSWQSLNAVSQGLQASYTSASTYAAVTSGTINTTVSGLFVPSSFTGAPAISPTDPAIAEPREKLFRTLERFPLAEQARKSIVRLGLTVRSVAYRTPLDLLDEAVSAMQTPSLPGGRPTSALLPLRECIDASIAELIRRRKSQEQTPKRVDKLRSLGRYCSRADLQADHFERMGQNADKILDQLSGSKQANHSRERVSELFHEGLLLLNGLLESIDETKLRPA